MNQETLARLFDYHYWANRQLWRSVIALSDEQFTKELSDRSPSVQAQIVGMVANENLWINYLWHGEVEFLQGTHFPTRASIRQEWDAREEEIRDFVDELHPADLARPVQPPFLTTSAPLMVWEILLQVIHHAVDCRAQLRLHLDRLDVLSPACGFFDYVAHQSAQTAPQQPMVQWAAQR